MENCLVTKLNTVVDNNRIPKIDSAIIEFSVPVGSSSYEMAILSPEDSIITILDDGYTFTQNGVSVKSAAPNSRFTIPSGNYYVSVDKKYDITALVNESQFAFPLDVIKFNSTITSLSGAFVGDLSSISNFNSNSFEYCRIAGVNNTISGNIDALKNYTNLKEIIIRSNMVIGDLSTIGDFESVKNGVNTLLVIANTGISGTVESLVIKLRNIENSGSINLNIGNCPNVTVGTHTGAEFTDTASTFEWTQTSFAYVNGSNVFERGNTQEKITEWQNAGKTVISV